MAERSLRGASIGAHSLETEEGVVFADRIRYQYLCPSGHEVSVAFAADADVPEKWECRECSAEATISTAEIPNLEQILKPQRTHWDMLRERRTIEEINELLEERLEQYRSGEALFDDDFFD